MCLGMELLPSIGEAKFTGKVIDARNRFAKRRYEHEFKWNPSKKVVEGIVRALSAYTGKAAT